MSILKAIKNKIIDKTSDVLSLPARIRAKKVMRQAEVDTQAIKADRASGGNFIEPNPSNPASVSRWLADDARYRRDPAFKAKVDARRSARRASY